MAKDKYENLIRQLEHDSIQVISYTLFQSLERNRIHIWRKNFVQTVSRLFDEPVKLKKKEKIIVLKSCLF